MASVHKETLLVFDAPAEQVVSDCRRLAAQLLYLVPFVHPRQVDEHVRMARVFFFNWLLLGLYFSSLLRSSTEIWITDASAQFAIQ